MAAVLAIGETLVDLISAAVVDDLSGAVGFRKYIGGQVTNLALNLTRLGVKTMLVSCVGDDPFGSYARREIDRAGLSTEAVQITSQAATSVSIIARHTGTPDFVIHRGADPYIKETSLLREAAKDCQILHTSAFALSREPARSLILKYMRKGKRNGALVSLDPNYHPKIWPDTDSFLQLFAEACQYVDVTKPSLDDCHRIMAPGLSDEQYARQFMSWGVQTVIITKGARGVFLAQKDGQRLRIHPNNTQVADVTGAGDAFWAGYLTATLSGSSQSDAARLGQALAEQKIRTVGPVHEFPAHDQLIEAAQLIRFERLETRKGGDEGASWTP
jgi:sugar/nucleoside kinase (ribokinase family)